MDTKSTTTKKTKVHDKTATLATVDGGDKTTPIGTVDAKAVEKMGGVVTMKLQNGLGNQLFQVAAGLRYAEETGRRCVFLRDSESPSWPHPRPTYWDTVFRALDTVRALPTADVTFRTGGNPAFAEIPAHPTAKTVDLMGLYLSAHYACADWPQRTPKLLRTLCAPSMWNDARDRLQSLVRPAPLSRCAFVHVRRGDLRSVEARLEGRYTYIIGPEYYRNALAMPQWTSKTVFVVFHEPEDKDAVRRQFTVLGVGRNVYFAPPASDFTHLLMMALCEMGGILANSTFSIWAAYSNICAGANFIAPDAWSLPKTDDAQLDHFFPPYWIRLPRT